MNKTLSFFLVAVLLVVSISLVGCKTVEPTPTTAPTTTPTPTPTPEPEPEFTWPKNIDFVTMGTTGAAYAQTIAWGTLLKEDTGTRVRLVSADHGTNQYRYLKEGRFFSGTVSFADDMLTASLPEWSDRDMGPGDFRVYYPLSVYYNGYAVRGDSDINSPADVKGKKVGYFAHYGPAGEALIQALLDWAEIEKDEVTWVPMSGAADLGPAIRDGTVDVVMSSSNIPIWYEVEASPHGLKWIPLDATANPEAAARFEATFPTGTGWGPTKAGVPSSLDVPMMEIIAPQYTVSQWDPELVYNLVKWLDENYDRYKDAHPNFETMTPEFLLRIAETNYIPLHEGSVMYLVEKGMWTDKHQARWEQNVDLLEKWINLWQAAISKADDQGILVSPDNEDPTQVGR
jgi:hypothetical protein